MMKLGGYMYVYCTKISAELEFGIITPLRGHPPQCGVGLRRRENQRKLSSFVSLFKSTIPLIFCHTELMPFISLQL